MHGTAPSYLFWTYSGPSDGLLDSLQSMDLTLQVERVAASIVDSRGRTSELTFFLHNVSPHHFATETVFERLNDPETRFLPCEFEKHTELVRLSSLSYVEMHGQAPEIKRLEETGAVRRKVELELDCGDSLAGELIYEAPQTADRVSDLLNSRAPRFLLLVSGERTLFIRRDAIARVHL